MKNEIMDGEQFAAAMDGEPTFEELEEMTAAKKRRSREENDARMRQLEKERLEKERNESDEDDSANSGDSEEGDPQNEEREIPH